MSAVLTGVRRVYLDSQSALDWARANGLAADATVRTAAPALLARPAATVVQVDADLSTPRLRDLGKRSFATGQALAAVLSKSGDPESIGVLAARTLLSSENLIAKAMTLAPEDFDQPVAVIQDDLGAAAIETHYNTEWQVLLADNPELRRHKVETGARPSGDPHPEPTLLDRLRFEPPTSLIFRLLLALGDRLPIRGPRGTAYVLKYTSLVKETAVALAGKGMAIRTLEPPKPDFNAVPSDLEDRIAAIAGPALREYLSELVTPEAVPGLERALLTRLVENTKRFYAAKASWKRVLPRLQQHEPAIVLHGFPSGPSDFALFDTSGDMNLPIVSFQHGVSREINETIETVSPVWENNLSDMFLTYGTNSARISTGSPFNTARCISVGFSADYRRTGTYRKAHKTVPPILYATTALYAGCVQPPSHAGVADAVKMRFECGMVDQVLGALPHRVRYKAYMQDRYLDPDPVIALARTKPNIDLYEKAIDLRYLLVDARIIVTARATSTFAWCLMSGRPVVFIDIPDQAPLRKRAREAMAEGLFLIDAGAAGFHDTLRNLLSQPIVDIEAAYVEKAEARQKRLLPYLGKSDGNAGERAADIILETLRDGKRQSTSAMRAAS